MAFSIPHADEAVLQGAGRKALELLCQQRFQGLADQFGYAVAFGRDTAQALADDFRALVSQKCPDLAAEVIAPGVVRVKWLSENSANLAAVIECFARMPNGIEILLELVVSKQGDGYYVSIEDISAVA
jgi:hypothetical protein